jgi:HemY protein
MRGVVWLVLLFTVAVVAATTLGGNDGVISIYWSGWRTDLSLNLFVVLLVGFCVLLTMASQALYSVTTLPRRAGEWRALRKERLAQMALREALAEYFSARYGRAQKAALRAIQIQHDATPLQPDAEFTVLAQLLAAASAHRLQDRARRDALLKEALPQAPRAAHRADDGARLLAAEWALDDRDAARAAALLAELPPGAARRTQALRLKLQAHRLQREPLAALHSARHLANHGAFSAVAAQGLLRTIAHEAIDSTHDMQQLRRVWEQLEAADRRDAIVAARAAQRAGALEAHEDGRQWLRPFWDRLSELARDEREAVAMALIDVCDGIGNDWLPRLEAAALAYTHEAMVIAAVGCAYAERQLWGKARKLLEQTAAATALPPVLRRRAWRQLAQLANQEGDETRARRCEQAAAAID